MYAYLRHIGDYHRDAGFLTPLQHGYYGLLMDHYYAQEKPIPDDMAHMIARGPRDDIEPILRLFFVRDGDVWRHKRIDDEIATYHSRGDQSRENGKKGGRPPGSGKKKTQPKPGGNPAGTNPVSKAKKKATAGLGENINVPPGLQRFLDAYPKGKRNKLAEVVKVWERDELEDFADVIVKDVERRKVEHWQWVKDGGTFIPGSQVYLNGKRWNDDIEPIPAAAGGRRAVLEHQNAQRAQDWADK